MARIPLGALTTLNTALHLDPMFIELYSAAGGDFSAVTAMNVGMSGGTRRLNVGGIANVSAVLKSTVASGGAGSSALYFGNSASDTIGYVNYDHTSNYMSFGTNGVERGRITGVGEWAFGGSGGSGARLNIFGGTLPTTGSGWQFSSGLAAGRLATGDTTNGMSVANAYQDSSVIEVSAGTTAGYQSGIVFNARSAIVNPGTVQIFTYGGMRFQLDSAGNVSTGTDNAQTLGTASRRWSVVYAGTGAINTSDEREKTAVEPLTDAELSAASALAREIGSFQWLSSIAEKGEDAARIHIGMTVQKAMGIMTGFGLDPLRYAFICYDEWEEKVTPAQVIPAITRERSEGTGILDDKGEEIMRKWEEVVEEERVIPEHIEPAGNRYGFRYDQLTLFIVRGQEERLRRLEDRS